MMRICLTVLGLFLLPGFVQAKPLVAEISSHDITIHSAFEGTQLTLFGARNDPGDIVVVVRGPERDAKVWRKERIAGIWVQRHPQTFDRIPSFYAMASSRPIEEIKKSIYFDALGIDERSAIEPYLPENKNTEPSSERDLYARALIRHLRGEELYHPARGEVSFIGRSLFKTAISFPDRTPPGLYTAEAYLFRDGQVVGMHATPIQVYKSGFDAFVYALAQQYPWLYGLIAIAMAALIGWSASLVFQRL